MEENYMKTKENLRNFLILFVALILVSCATAPEEKKMIPYIDFSTFSSSGRTIKIIEVKGGGETGWDVPKIDNTSFKEALVGTLKKSGLFKQILTDHTGDYQLDTEIVSQKIQPGLTAYAALFVHYRLIETKTNQVVWTENIFSQNDAFGENQGKDVLEGAARDNLAQLIRKLADILSRQN
jgi:hypothetical protein